MSLFAATMALAYAEPTPEQKMSKLTAPDVGEKAIDFALPYATKDTLVFEGMKLSDLFGKGPIILAFYPAAWSGGCTKEMCAFRDNFSALQELNAQIIAISGDYVYSHHEWAKHHNLPFSLVSDYGGKVAKQYDSWNDDYGMCKRTVFLIDNQGKIAYRDLEYSVKDQKDFEDLKKALADLKK
jgi:peroxiredoxin